MVSARKGKRMTTKSKTKKPVSNPNANAKEPPAAKASSSLVRRAARIEDSPVVVFAGSDSVGVYLPLDVAAATASLLAEYANIKRVEDYGRATMADRLVRVLHGPLLVEYSGAPADSQPLIAASINETEQRPKMEILLRPKRPLA
jgi:hypothetical protein